MKTNDARRGTSCFMHRQNHVIEQVTLFQCEMWEVDFVCWIVRGLSNVALIFAFVYVKWEFVGVLYSLLRQMKFINICSMRSFITEGKQISNIV